MTIVPSIREYILLLKSAAEREGHQLQTVKFDSWPRTGLTIAGVHIEASPALAAKLTEGLTMHPVNPPPDERGGKMLSDALAQAFEALKSDLDLLVPEPECTAASIATFVHAILDVRLGPAPKETR